MKIKTLEKIPACCASCDFVQVHYDGNWCTKHLNDIHLFSYCDDFVKDTSIKHIDIINKESGK